MINSSDIPQQTAAVPLCMYFPNKKIGHRTEYSQKLKGNAVIENYKLTVWRSRLLKHVIHGKEESEQIHQKNIDPFL